MITLFFVIAITVLAVVKLAYRKKESILPFAAWVVCGLLFLCSLAAALYYSFLMPATEGLRGYGSVSWLYIIATVSGLAFVLYGNRHDGLGALRIFGWVVLVPVLLLSYFMANHIDDKASRVFYEDGQYRIEKKNLVSHYTTLPYLVVAKGITEKYYSIQSKIKLGQENVVKATLTAITSDSLQISFYHNYNPAQGLPNPLVTGVRMEP